MYTGMLWRTVKHVWAILINDFTGAPTWYKGVTYSKSVMNLWSSMPKMGWNGAALSLSSGES